MQLTQIYDIVNGALQETLGESAVLNEDLSNIVDMGEAVFNAGAANIYSRNLVNRIGKVVFSIKKYSGRAPSVYMDAWEWGSVKQKITFEMTDAEANPSWELENGQSYDPNVFTEPQVDVKYWNSKTTFQVAISITEEMLKQSFTSAEQLNALTSGIFTYIENRMTIDTDNLVMRTINNFTATTINDNNANRVIKLLTNYNTSRGLTGDDALTAEEALRTPDFIKYMALQMELIKSRISTMSNLFNIGGKSRFTTADQLHIVTLADVKAAADVYLQSDTFHKEYTALPNSETIPYWQGSGTNYAFDSVSKIDVTIADNETVTQTGVIGVMFDREALGVSCMNKRTTTNYNGLAEFTNYWFKQDAHYFNDTNENFVVFLLA